MMVTVKSLDGELIAYAYDPQHANGVVAFYDDLKLKCSIENWWIS